MNKILILLGLVLLVAGLLWKRLDFSFFKFFGKLPGDINIQGDGYNIHLPITTCILLSVAASLVLWIVRALMK